MILPFIVRAQFMSTFVADIACIAAICYYCYITFLGSDKNVDLPFVKTPFVFLIIGGVLCCVVLVFMSFGVNIPKRLLLTYFSSLCVCFEIVLMAIVKCILMHLSRSFQQTSHKSS